MNRRVSGVVLVALGFTALGCGQLVREGEVGSGGAAQGVAEPDAGGTTLAQGTGASQGSGGAMAVDSGGAMAVHGGDPASDAGRASDDGAVATDAGPVDPVDAGLAEATDAAMEVGRVSFSVQTKASGTSEIAPRHVAAVWVEDQQGERVRLLARYGLVSARFLLTFKEVWPEYVRTLPLPPDVVSTASLNRFQLLTMGWDLRDEAGEVVPDGTYVVVVESTDSNQTSWVKEVPFDLGSDPVTIDLPESEFFGPIHLEYTPD